MITTLKMTQGRVTIPEHILRDLNLDPNESVQLDVERPKKSKVEE